MRIMIMTTSPAEAGTLVSHPLPRRVSSPNAKSPSCPLTLQHCATQTAPEYIINSPRVHYQHPAPAKNMLPRWVVLDLKRMIQHATLSIGVPRSHAGIDPLGKRAAFWLGDGVGGTILVRRSTLQRTGRTRSYWACRRAPRSLRRGWGSCSWRGTARGGQTGARSPN